MSGILSGMLDRGALAGLEQAVLFTTARHERLLSNIANADTPGYRRSDLDVDEFRRTLARAYERDEKRTHGAFAGIVGGNRRLGAAPRPFGPAALGRGPLRHDGNDVSVEREMALVARNAGEYSAHSALLRKGYRVLRAAITGRPEES